MSKDRQHLLNEGKLVEREKQTKLKSKDLQNALNLEIKLVIVWLSSNTHIYIQAGY